MGPKLEPVVAVGWLMIVLAGVALVALAEIVWRYGLSLHWSTMMDPHYAGAAWALPVAIATMASGGAYLVLRKRVGWFAYLCDAILAAYAAWFDSMALLVAVLLSIGATIYADKHERTKRC